ncbi:TolC family protein [Dyadobacter sp.]|uniref:TolC family protein n=1 Tax=Dyadobacter sp. TaxID=1914288 RepID=UPI003F708AD4
MPYLKITSTFFLLFFSYLVYGQKPDTTVSLREALTLAEKNYPLLKSKYYESEAAKKDVALSRNTIIPSLDLSYQANLATYNNITGMLNPSGIFPISGPPSAENIYQPVFGSAAGVSMNWQAITFGQRDAQTAYATAGVNQKESDSKMELFRHLANVTNTYLDAALAKQLIAVNQKNIKRVEFALIQSRTLTSKGLKPGVDTALFQSELSKSRIELLNATERFETQKIMLSQFLAVNEAINTKDSLFFEKFPQAHAAISSDFSNHPYVSYPKSILEYSLAKEKLIKRSYLPKINIWSTAYARGSGIKYDGTVKASDGLGFSRFNYGLGFQIVYPILKFSDKNLQIQQQNLMTQSIQQKVEENLLILDKKDQISQVTYNNAYLIATETATQLQSAQYAFKAMQIRYNTGLVNFSDLIQAQYNLLKAETDSQQSYWYIWKALLNKAVTKGDINIFLNELK